MFINYYPPHPALLEYVEMICIMGHQFSPDDKLSPIYTYMPTHTRFLSFYLEDCVIVKTDHSDFQKRTRCTIIGPQLKPVTLDLGKKNCRIIVIFKPCGFYRLLGIPLKEIVNCDFDASLVMGKEITEIVEQLMNTQDHAKRNIIIQKYLLFKLNFLKPILPIDFAMKELVSSFGHLSMEMLASKSCVCIRQLERQSLDRVGLPPKYFAKMIRFSEAYKFKERNPHSTWTEITHRFSYFDQMHLIRDFHHFTGHNPSTFTEEEILHSVKFSSIDH